MSKVQGVAAIVVSLSVVPAVTAAKAEPIAAGPTQQIVGLGGNQIPIFTYRPTGCADPSLLLVFHGAERNAEDYRDYARALADRHCMLVAAPLFAQHTFPSWRYQRGGIVDKNGQPRDPGKWTGQLVIDLVDRLRRQEGRPLAYSLIAHSAGGQFLSRLAAFVPTQAQRIVIANAGTYVLPSLTIDAPYGLGKIYAGADGEEHLQRYLQQPITVYLGAADNNDDERNNSPEARAQGRSRHERGLNVFNAAKALAQARGWTLNWRLVELPGVGHDGEKMLAAPQASEALKP